MYYIYSFKTADKHILPIGFSVEQENVTPFSNVHTFLWNLTKGKGFYKKYTLVNSEGKKVSFAEVLNKCPFLRFLPKDAIHIGPCLTPEEFRGNGYYPLLLKHIASQYESTECYMFVREGNTASIKGIEKAGFKRIGTCKKHFVFYY